MAKQTCSSAASIACDRTSPRCAACQQAHNRGSAIALNKPEPRTRGLDSHMRTPDHFGCSVTTVQRCSVAISVAHVAALQRCTRLRRYHPQPVLCGPWVGTHAVAAVAHHRQPVPVRNSIRRCCRRGPMPRTNATRNDAARIDATRKKCRATMSSAPVQHAAMQGGTRRQTRRTARRSTPTLPRS